MQHGHLELGLAPWDGPVRHQHPAGCLLVPPGFPEVDYFQAAAQRVEGTSSAGG